MSITSSRLEPIENQGELSERVLVGDEIFYLRALYAKVRALSRGGLK